MANADLSRRVEKLVGYPPLVEMDARQRRELRGRCSAPVCLRIPAEPGAGWALYLTLAQARAAKLAIACLLGGSGFLTVAEAGWAHGVGVAMLFAAMPLGLAATAPGLLENEPR